MNVKKYIFVLLGLILFASCTFNVEIDDLIIANEMCDDLIEQFAIEEDPNYIPTDYGCSGYSTDENNICLTKCITQDNCDPEHYCDYSSSSCVLKGAGQCSGDNHCRQGICLCDMCLDLMSLVIDN